MLRSSVLLSQFPLSAFFAKNPNSFFKRYVSEKGCGDRYKRSQMRTMLIAPTACHPHRILSQKNVRIWKQCFWNWKILGSLLILCSRDSTLPKTRTLNTQKDFTPAKLLIKLWRFFCYTSPHFYSNLVSHFPFFTQHHLTYNNYTVDNGDMSSPKCHVLSRYFLLWNVNLSLSEPEIVDHYL